MDKFCPSAFVFILAIAFCVNTQAQKDEPRVGTAMPGVGIENIVVGVSTLDDVAKRFGDKFKRIEHKKYSIEYEYKKLGLAFYACMADPQKQIFDIEITPPYIATTSQGTTLGATTKDAAQRLQTDTGGISFEYDENEIVRSMDIFESEGLRQCDSKFGVLKDNNGQ